MERGKREETGLVKALCEGGCGGGGCGPQERAVYLEPGGQGSQEKQSGAGGTVVWGLSLDGSGAAALGTGRRLHRSDGHQSRHL